MNSRPFTILLVSPDRSVLRRLSKFLEVFGFDVRQATASPQALAAAQAARPDFLILDANGGDPVDLQLCRQIRRVWPQGYTYALLLAEKPEVADVTAALEAGFDDFLAAPIVFGELLARLRAGARVIEFERRLAEQSGIEPVTGLADKATLDARLQARANGAKGPVGWLALVDLDYFFRISDQLGRQAAEALLQTAAQLVEGRCQGDSLAASLADDRIAVLLPPAEGEATITWAEETLNAIADRTFEFAGQTLHLTASCGVTQVAAGEPLEVVLARAQRALQLAKGSGRNCVGTSEEVDRDAEEWAAFASDGKLFQTTLARDVMMPCPLLLHVDETLEQAHACLELTGLHTVPVVDGDGKLAGIVSLEQVASARSKDKQSRGGNSVRLVRHAMSADVTRFEEATPLGKLMEFFTGDTTMLAVVVRDKKPRGVVHCQALAALNDRLSVAAFAATKPRTGSSEDLLVPDLALAE
jgi:diguanylate cyclase (GGDEF)-like protein